MALVQRISRVTAVLSFSSSPAAEVAQPLSHLIETARVGFSCTGNQLCRLILKLLRCHKPRATSPTRHVSACMRARIHPCMHVL
jgi:hypothetical protein